MTDFPSEEQAASNTKFSMDAERQEFLDQLADKVHKVQAKELILVGIQEQKVDQIELEGISLPPLDQVVSKVISWSDPGVRERYSKAVTKYYDTTVDPPVRTALMDLIYEPTNTAQIIYNIGTEQNIFNLGTQHDRDPDSRINKLLKERVKTYVTSTPVDQQIFILEGLNFSEGAVLPQFLVDEVTIKEGETEEQALDRCIHTFGEIGVGLFYNINKGVTTDLNSELSRKEEVDALKSAGLSLQEIALTYLPKELDIYKTPGQNEFSEEFIFTPDQIMEAVGKVIEETGLKKDDYQKAKAAGEDTFPIINQALQEINAVMKTETGQELLSLDFKPLYKKANDLARYNDTSQVFGISFKVFNDSRDKHIVSRVYKAVVEGKSPMLIFGDSHTFKIDPALEYLAVGIVDKETQKNYDESMTNEEVEMEVTLQVPQSEASTSTIGFSEAALPAADSAPEVLASQQAAVKANKQEIDAIAEFRYQQALKSVEGIPGARVWKFQTPNTHGKGMVTGVSTWVPEEYGDAWEERVRQQEGNVQVQKGRLAEIKTTPTPAPTAQLEQREELPKAA